MYDDFFEDNEKTFEEILEEIDHSQWCALNCLRILNDLIEKGIMKMSNGGDPPFVLTDKGIDLVDRYWNEVMKREPNKEDIELGMEILKHEGLV